MNHQNSIVALLPLFLVSTLVGMGCEKDKSDRTQAPNGDSTKEPLTEVDPPGESSAAFDKPNATPTAKAHMQEHLDQAERLRKAVQQGKLDESRPAAAWLAEHELTPRLAASWKPHIERMKQAAVAARDADDLQASADAIGQLGEACASCHREIAGPSVEDSTPPTGADRQAQMQLHAWAADQMWAGVIIPSDEAWQRGAEAMARAELTPEILFPDRSPGPELLALEEEVQRLASESRTVKGGTATDNSRGKTYASLLATCSACHTGVRGRR